MGARPRARRWVNADIARAQVNHFGRLELGAALRHKDDPFVCPQFAVASSLLYRWCVQRMPVPAFKAFARGTTTVQVRADARAARAPRA